MAGDVLLLQLSFVIGVAAILALVGRLIKQPPIIAYLLAGIIVGPLFFNILHGNEVIDLLARLGVAFLLFIVGLNLDFRLLKEVGGVSIVVGFGQIIFTAVIGLIIAIGLGFSYIPALYIAVALAFSSTVVAVKLLSDKNELDTLHGKIALGILIVQDFVAAFVLMMVPVLDSTGTVLIFWQLGKAVLLIAAVFIFASLVFPGALSVAARNQEILFLVSVAWALLVSILFDYFGFSLAIGALLAGMSLASSKYSLEISGKIKGVRDFFVVMFFVFFGSQFAGPITLDLITQAGIFSLFVLIGNPLIVMVFMRMYGYKKRTNFFVGITLAQISEFSLILLLIGYNLGFVEQSLLSLSILIALITIALSSYGIYYSQPLFKLLSPLLNVFDGRKREKLGYNKTGKRDYDILLFGYNRIGFNLLKAFNKAKKRFEIIDYNPDVIRELSRKGINCTYGDATDVDLLKNLHLGKSKLIISTIPHMDISMTILRNIKDKKNKIIFIPTSHHIEDTLRLYEEGADYVIMPHFLGGDFVAHMLTKDNFNKKLLDKEGAKQLKELNERLLEGQKHPSKESHGD